MNTCLIGCRMEKQITSRVLFGFGKQRGGKRGVICSTQRTTQHQKDQYEGCARGPPNTSHGTLIFLYQRNTSLCEVSHRLSISARDV